MKNVKNYALALTLVLLTFGAVGCKHRPKEITPIHGLNYQSTPTNTDSTFGMAGTGSSSGTTTTDGAGTDGAFPPVNETGLGDGLAIGDGEMVSDGGTLDSELVPVGGEPTDTGLNSVSDLPATTEGGIPAPQKRFGDHWVMNESLFKSNTLYFALDRATVEADQRHKVEEIALYLGGKKEAGILIDGHCDERGTEEYNRVLGERRAQAVREYLVNLGIDPNRIYTRSFGEDLPAVEGATPAAWAKNRRAEFIELTPAVR